MDEYENHGDRLEEISTILGNINNKLDRLKPSAVWSVVGLFVVFVLIPKWANSILDSKTRYALQYAVSDNQAFVAKEPRDCDFISAPLGDKNCHYEKAVSASKCGTDNNTQKPVISYDDGKTWNWMTEGIKCSPSVAVTWTKVKE